MIKPLDLKPASYFTSLRRGLATGYGMLGDISSSVLVWLAVLLPMPLCGVFAWIYIEQTDLQASANEKLVSLQYATADFNEGLTQIVFSDSANPLFERMRGIILMQHAVDELTHAVGLMRLDPEQSFLVAADELERDIGLFRKQLQLLEKNPGSLLLDERGFFGTVMRLQTQQSRMRSLIRADLSRDLEILQRKLYLAVAASVLLLILVAFRLRSLMLARAQIMEEMGKTETALRESDRRFRALLSASTENVWIAEARFETLRFDPPLKLQGRPPQVVFDADEWINVVHPEDRAPLLLLVRQAFEGKSHLRSEFRIESGDGGWSWMDSRAVPVLDEQGQITEWLGMSIDTTKRHMVEEQLRQAHKMEAVGQLTGGIAHDFNNLLAIILGNLELLHERLKEPQNQKLGENAMRAAERGSELVHRLLAFGRRQSLRPSIVDLAAHLPGLLSLLTRTLGDRIEVRLSGDSYPLLVMVDITQLENAILNLAINARDAISGAGRLTLTLDRVTGEFIQPIGTSIEEGAPDPSKTYAMIALTDTGSGMSRHVLERAFDPFFTTKPVGQGSGMGLSMVHGFVRQSQGYLGAESSIGRGTTIRIFLPAATVEIEQRGPLQLLPAASAGMVGKSAVLLVDDDAGVREVVAMMLGGFGHVVTTAANADEALRLMRTARFDLLVTDIQMPGRFSGVDLADEAEKAGLVENAIFMSGSEPPKDALKRLSGRDRPFVQKPIRRATLAAAITAVTNQKDAA